MKGFKPTGYGPTAGFKFPASFGFTGSSGAYTNVQPYIRRAPRAFKDGGYVSQMVGDTGSALERRTRSSSNLDQESGGKTPVRPGYSKGGANWIAGATKNKGALHRALGVPEGQKIPAKKMAKAASSKNPTMRKRAALAKTLGKMHKADGGMVSPMMGASPLATLNRMRRKPPRPPIANTVKEKFAADGGEITREDGRPPRRIKDYTVMEGLRAAPALAREGIDYVKRAMSSGRRAVGPEGRSVMDQVDTDVNGKTTANNYSRGGKMKRMGYSHGGKMKRMGYAKGGGVSMGEAKKIAERTIGEHVRYPAPKGHKGLGAMCK